MMWRRACVRERRGRRLALLLPRPLTALGFLAMVVLPEGVRAAAASVDQNLKIAEAKTLAETTMTDFFMMFWNCVTTSMPRQRFLVDDLQSFIFSPARTTVGFAPKFTSNRKFFSNLISTRFFKNMIDRDEETVRKNFVKKIEFCDEVVMDESMLREFYDREVDQSKMRKK